MIGAPQRVSMPLARPFIETSRAPLVRPSAKETPISSGRSGARPGPIAAKAKASEAKRVARAMPRRGARRPVSGIARTAPAAKPSSARLRAPSVRCSRACNSGSEAAQAPMPRPSQRKIALLATRSDQRPGEDGREDGAKGLARLAIQPRGDRALEGYCSDLSFDEDNPFGRRVT